jgi:hypothetical protein
MSILTKSVYDICLNKDISYMIKVEYLASTITTSIQTAYRVAHPNADQPISSWIKAFESEKTDRALPADTWLSSLLVATTRRDGPPMNLDELVAGYLAWQFCLAIQLTDRREKAPHEISAFLENVSGGLAPRRHRDIAVHESDICKAALRGVQLAYGLTSGNKAADLSRWLVSSNDNVPNNAPGDYARSLDGICRMIDDAMIEHVHRIALLSTHQRLSLKVAREIFALGRLLDDAGDHGIAPTTFELLDRAA